MNRILLILLLLGSINVSAQTGSIRGRIIENITERPLEGATIVYIGDTDISATADKEGRYKLNNLPVGRITISVSYIGYDEVILPNIEVISGKDVPIDIQMTESFNTLDEVVISVGPRKDRALNNLATVSARQVSVEEITKYAGGRSEVARLATNFAGVSAPDDSRNDIIVLGNSPTGV